MDINTSLKEKISDFPQDLQELAKIVIDAIESGKTKTKVTEIIKDEIREMVLEEE